MGNRAVVKGPDIDTGVYLHWNGGLESVAGICMAAKELGYRDPVENPCYSLARFAFLAGILMCEDGLSLGIGNAEEDLDGDPDNGIYTIGKGWKIIKREGSGKGPLNPKGEAAEFAKKLAKELVARVSDLRESANRERGGVGQ